MEHGFTWFGAIPGLNKLPIHIVTAVFTLVLLMIAVMRASKSLKRSAEPAIPDGKLSFRNIFELIIEYVLGMMENIIGHNYHKYLPLVGALFIYILFCNLLGLVPGFLPATDNINTNGGCALVVFLMYNYYGIKEHGVKYLKQFTGPVWYLAPIMLLVEIMSHLFRPCSLSIRLFGNMFGDHTVIAIFSDLTKLVIPVVFLCLGILVCVIQALVFSLLTAVYIGLAVSHDH